VQYNIVQRKRTIKRKGPENKPERKIASLAKIIRTQIQKLRRTSP
jgi:hypothetical protein